MKRLIKFRAIKDDPATFDFVYGNLIYLFEPINKKIIPQIQCHCDFSFISCLSNTEQQCTGMPDEENMEIYEGDIVKQIYEAGFSLYEVCFGYYDNGESQPDNECGNGWYLRGIYRYQRGLYSNLETIYSFGEGLYPFNSTKPLIVGNIFKNETLLKLK
jgi:hypothetical protein